MVKRKTRVKLATTPLPSTPEDWLEEVARAYLDAADSMLVDPTVAEKDLFHLGPVVCVKFRGLKGSRKSLEAATETALTSYVATISQDPKALSDPRVAFAFCYLTAHFGLDLLTDAQVSDLMDFVVEKRRQLVKMIQASSKG